MSEPTEPIQASPTPLTDKRNSDFKARERFLDTIDMYPMRPDESYLFRDTPFAVTVPGYRDKDTISQELGSLTPDQLDEEPYNEFIRHLFMFDRFAKAEQITNLVPIVIGRVGPELDSYLADIEAKYPKSIPWTNEIYPIATRSILKCLDQKDFNLTPDQVQRLYSLGRTSGTIYFLRPALVADSKNTENGTSQGLEEQFVRDLSRELLDSCNEVVAFNVGLDDQLIEAYDANPELPGRILVEALKLAVKPYQVYSVVGRVLTTTGLETVRKLLRDQVNNDPNFRSNFNLAMDYLGLDHTGEYLSDLKRDIYDKIEFSEYKPNAENQEFEVNLVKKEFEGKRKVLDVACGTGRLLEALDNDSLSITGVDAVEKHIKYIKERRPESDVLVGSWATLPFSDGSFDSAYCLGRSFAHNVTVNDAIECLQEIGRVISDDGIVLLDLPDTSKGEYPKLIERTHKIAKERGIFNFTLGLINDGPDDEHFFDRFIPDDEQMKAITMLAGFEAEKIATKSYEGTNGEENINNYWRLRKTSLKMSPRLREDALKYAHKSAFTNKEIKNTIMGIFQAFQHKLDNDPEFRMKHAILPPSMQDQTMPSSFEQLPDGE